MRKSCAEIFDVAIVGACITGISTALCANRNGLSTLLIESGQVGLQTSGRYITPLNKFFDKPYREIIAALGLSQAVLMADAATTAIEFIENNIKLMGIKCDFRPIPTYVFSAEKKYNENLEIIRSGCEDVGLQIGTQLSMPYPITQSKVFSLSDQCIFNNVAYIKSLAHYYMEAGGKLRENARLLKVDEEKNSFTLHTARGKFRARQVVYTPQTTRIMRFKFLKFIPYKYFCLLASLSTPYPEALAYEIQDFYRGYITINHPKGSFLAASGEDRKWVKGFDPAKQFELLEKGVRRKFNIDSILAKWSHIYYRTPDNLPYIGGIPGCDNTYVASGFNTDASVLGTISALILTDMIMGKDNKFSKLFSIDRLYQTSPIKVSDGVDANV